jgi:DNA primase
MNWYKIAQNIDIEQHLRERGVDPQKTKVYIDKETNTATFPLFNYSGQMVGYQQYNPLGDKKAHDKEKSKYWNYIKDEQKKMAVWGLESVKETDRILFVTEGIFDAVKIHNAGFPALAVLSNDPHRALRGWFKILNKKIIAIVDRDDAGSKLRTIAHEFYITPFPYKDLGEMPQSEVNRFIRNILNKRS